MGDFDFDNIIRTRRGGGGELDENQPSICLPPLRLPSLPDGIVYEMSDSVGDSNRLLLCAHQVCLFVFCFFVFYFFGIFKKKKKKKKKNFFLFQKHQPSPLTTTTTTTTTTKPINRVITMNWKD